MSFASLPFVALVALSVVLYYLVPKRSQWIILLLASMAFYLSGGVKSAAWLVLVAGITWLTGLLLARQNARPGRIRTRRRPCAARKSVSAPSAPCCASGFYTS